MQKAIARAAWTVFLCASAAQAQDVVPLPNAHAHNDYLHARPLLDALDHGFCSVEADIHLVEGALLVAHDADEVDPARTLEGLYLEPLRERAKLHGGRVYPDGPVVMLLIDLKTAAEPTYAVLRPLLASYADILVTQRGDTVQSGAVQVVLSGNRPIAQLLAEEYRVAFLDGRPDDLELDHSSGAMPLVSQNWNSLFTWRGEGPMPSDERTKLETLAEKTHAKGAKLRLWATAEDTAVWKELRAAGVDFINTDKLAALRDFLTE